MLHFNNVTFQYPGSLTPIFRNLSFSVPDESRLGIVGANGSGKSTVLKLIAGNLVPTDGTIVAPSTTVVNRSLTSVSSAISHLFLPELKGIYLQLDEVEERDPARFAFLVSEFSDRGGFEQLLKFEKSLADLNVEFETRDAECSEGWHQFLALSASLQSASMPAWDEPTNYLDSEKRALVKRQIASATCGIVFASHDRSLLSTADYILELERGFGRLYPGNYDDFVRQKSEVRLRDSRKAEKLSNEIKKLEKRARTYHRWGVKKEREKSGALDKGFVGARAARLEKRGIQAKARMQDSIDALIETKPHVSREYRFSISDSEFRGSCIQVRDVAVHANGDPNLPLLFQFSGDLSDGDRVAIVGPNGCGKSSLLKTLHRSKWNRRCNVRYVGQSSRKVGRICDLFPHGTRQSAIDLLGVLDIDGARYDAELGELSDGQRQKVYLAAAFVSSPDVLLLDEPTHHLDLPRVKIVESALRRWRGVLVVVSHDDDFVENISDRQLDVRDLS